MPCQIQLLYHFGNSMMAFVDVDHIWLVTAYSILNDLINWSNWYFYIKKMTCILLQRYKMYICLEEVSWNRLQQLYWNMHIILTGSINFLFVDDVLHRIREENRIIRSTEVHSNKIRWSSCDGENDVFLRGQVEGDSSDRQLTGEQQKLPHSCKTHIEYCFL